MGTSIRDILNRARWRDGRLHALEVHVLHRGAPGDRRVIGGSRIVNVGPHGIELTPENETEDGGAEAVSIPYHRFLAIVGADGRELWSKEGGASAAAAAGGPEPAAPPPAAREPSELRSELNVVLRGADADAKSLLVIDGSAGEGGGQLLRTSLSLSMITGRAFSLERIRAGRKKPGLMRQHLTCVKAAALICGADVEGAELGSTRVVFRPGAVSAGTHTIDIGSAGSVALVLQTLAIPLAHARAGSRIVVRGGTHVLWAPPYPFLEHAWLPLVRRANAHVDLVLTSSGFHPAGGGEVVMNVEPTDGWKPLHLGPTGVVGTLHLKAIVSGISEGIARRELSAAAELLSDSKCTLASETVRSAGPGNAIWLVARDEATGIANVFSGIGDPGVPAETIGQSVAKSFLAWRESGASVEEHLADQIMLPIALSGGGSYTTNALSLHAKTNIEVIHAFTGRRFRCFDQGPSGIRLALGE